MRKSLLFSNKRRQKGQSFVELLLVVIILALMLSGVVEFGFMINNYLHVVGASREAARVYNDYKFFDQTTWAANEDLYYRTAEKAASAMLPITLDPALGDDILISVVGVKGNEIRRFPAGDFSSNSWSLCANYETYAATYTNNDPPTTPPAELADPDWYHCPSHETRITNDDILARVNESSVFQSGMVIVEIIYDYPQVLKLPVFSHGEIMGVEMSLIPDPIPLYTYSIMPMSSAEPTSNP